MKKLYYGILKQVFTHYEAYSEIDSSEVIEVFRTKDKAEDVLKRYRDRFQSEIYSFSIINIYIDLDEMTRGRKSYGL